MKTNNNEKQTVIECRAEIATLKEKVCWLNQINDLTVALYQVLTPEQVDELLIMAEGE